MKKLLKNGKLIDTRVLKPFCGWCDEYAEMYLPDKAEKDRLAQINELEDLIEEFKKNNDKDSYEYAVEELKLAKGSYNEFVGEKYFDV